MKLEADLNGDGWNPTGARPAVILFDLDGTLRHSRPDSTGTFIDHAAALGVPLDDEQRRAAIRWTHYYWAQSPELRQDAAAFPGREAEFWTQYAYRCLRQMGCCEARALELAPEMHAYMTTQHNPINYVPPDVPETLAALKASGYRLGVLTNRAQPVTDELTQLELLEYFDLILAAGEVASWKPDPLIFQHALQRLSAQPGAALYVGDNYYADILGAQRAGLRPILLDPDGIFPEADCPVIHALGELVRFL